MMSVQIHLTPWRHLKTRFFQAAFNAPSGRLQRLRFIYVTNGAL